MNTDISSLPPGHHVATEAERKRLPPGSLLFVEGQWVASTLEGREAGPGSYVCPDVIPEPRLSCPWCVPGIDNCYHSDQEICVYHEGAERGVATDRDELQRQLQEAQSNVALLNDRGPNGRLYTNEVVWRLWQNMDMLLRRAERAAFALSGDKPLYPINVPIRDPNSNQAL